MRPVIAALLCSLCLLASSARAEDADPVAVVAALERAAAGAIDAAERSVVSIGALSDDARGTPLFRPFAVRAPSDAPDWTAAFGTGVILKAPGNEAERFVLTNRHVIQSAERSRDGGRARLVAILPEGIQIPLEVVASDPRSDLAALRLDLSTKGIDPSKVPALSLGEAETFRKGRFVITLGNPYAVARDGSASVSLGTIANISRSPWNGPRRSRVDEELTIHHLGTLWHLDARTPLGASGGAVVDLQGRLIGLTTSLAAVEGYESSIGYAIPMTPGFRRVVDSLLQGYEVEYGFLGIAPRTVRRWPIADLAVGERAGAEVASVARNSPADQAGLHSGDAILSVNGVGIRNEDDLIREVGVLGPDAVAQLEVRTAAGDRTLEVRLGKWPVYDDTAIVATRRRFADWRGLRVDYPTARRRYITTDLFDQYPQAVVITGVAAGSPAAAAGLREGEFVTHLGDQPVETPGQFDEALKNASGPQLLKLADGREITLAE